MKHFANNLLKSGFISGSLASVLLGCGTQGSPAQISSANVMLTTAMKAQLHAWNSAPDTEANDTRSASQIAHGPQGPATALEAGAEPQTNSLARPDTASQEPTLQTGVEDVDIACKSIFLALESSPTNLPPVGLNKLDADACLTQLIRGGAQLVEELGELGVELRLPLSQTQSIPLDAALYTQLAAKPQITNYVSSLAEERMGYERFGSLVEATAKYNYLASSIDELKAKDPDMKDPENTKDIIVSQLALDVQGELLAKLESRILKLDSLAKFSLITSAASTLTDSLSENKAL